MSCADFAEALVDERLPEPAGLRDHLDHCASCQALARRHASARAFVWPEPAPTTTPFTPEAIRGVVRRRQRRRQGVAAAGVSLGLVLAVLLVHRPGPGTSSPGDTVALGDPREGTVQVVDSTRVTATPSASASNTASVSSTPAPLGALVAEVEGYLHSRPAVDDDTYAVFGALAAWVRPPESRALESEPFRSALAALVVSRGPSYP